MKKEEINNELKALGATKLMHLSKQAAFRVEPPFFEWLEKEILQQTLSNTAVFSAPNTYFATLEKNVLNETSGHRAQQSSFNIPSDYFEQLEEQVVLFTSSSETPVRAMNSFKTKLKVFIGVAASFILGFILFNPTASEECITFACLLEQSELTEEDFLKVYDATLADELLEEVNLGEHIEVENDELIDYLIDEDIELYELTNAIES